MIKTRSPRQDKRRSELRKSKYIYFLMHSQYISGMFDEFCELGTHIIYLTKSNHMLYWKNGPRIKKKITVK